MTAGTIKIDKRLPYFFGGRGMLNYIGCGHLSAVLFGGLKPDFIQSAAVPLFSGLLICPICDDLNSANT